jgi:phage shock protein PspC (stress-responsive transcriptional regulator)
MKKTISINISGILFHIEEDGYTTLKKYLESINRHFSTYTDHQEIISDIENRIAEIFLSNLKNNKQVITAEDVSALIEKMGTIADFKAIEEELFVEAETKDNSRKTEESDFYKYITPPVRDGKGYKKLSRLENRKIIGGVCAGLANYFSIDPLWTRLIAILLLFSGKFNFGHPGWDFLPWNHGIHFSLGNWAIIAYIVMWIILPVSHEEPEDKNIKKLYRNPDDRTLGGVASGLGAYFGIQVIWMRLLFIGLLFAGGAGLLIYIILWIITPQARSITERIQMKGGAITLDNIETTIKENMNPTPDPADSSGGRAWLAPFRFLGRVINGLGNALGPMGSFLLAIIRVFFGLIIFIIGMAITITPLVLLSIYFNWIPQEGVFIGLDEELPMQWISEIVSTWLAVAFSTALLVPGIIIILLAISVWVKKSIIDGKFGLIALAIWLLSIGICAFQIPRVVAQFRTQATHTVEVPIETSGGVLVIKSENSSENSEFVEMVSVQIQGTDAPAVHLVQNFEARGRNRVDALTNAKEIDYRFTITDSILTFERGVDISKLNKFRVQQLQMELEIPFDKVFVMDKSLLPVIRNTIHRYGYKNRDVHSRNYWVFNSNGLHCLSCAQSQPLNSADSTSRAKFEGAYFMR